MLNDRCKIMIIDNNLISLMVTEEILTRHGFDVVKLVAPHGCIAKIAYERPDVLLLDVAMPRLAADDLLDSLCNTPECEDLVILLYSDMDAGTLTQICQAKNLHGYFCKSMDLNQLPDFIERFLEGPA